MDGVRCEYARPTAAGAVYEPAPPPPPRRKAFAERVHSALGFHLGFGGTIEENAAERDPATTFGANLRTDIPVAKYVLIGPFLQFGAWRPDIPNPPTRDYYFDLDLLIRGRIPVDLEPMGLQAWIGVPIGLTLSFLGNDHMDSQNLDGFGLGWDVGFLLGGAIHFSKRFGLFAELGWLQHRMSHDHRVGTGSTDLRLAQGNFNVGFIFGN